MDRLKKHLPFLQLLLNTDMLQQKALLKTMSDAQLSTLSEVAHNLIHWVLPFNSRHIKKLKPHKRVIRLLADEHIGTVRRKRHLIKNLKYIFLMLKIVLPLLHSMLN